MSKKGKFEANGFAPIVIHPLSYTHCLRLQGKASLGQEGQVRLGQVTLGYVTNQGELSVVYV